ncbi:MAG: cell division ATP-binding protein FtsE [Chloroflexi bacterium]|nr:cell division ATP-binding protein FtsE [Chloroflexota bacterium]HCU72804.1 cell division ATP-binding protein FtsE [Chloroflexota bacterium]
MIVLQGVSKTYEGFTALSNVSVSIARGEFAFLIGTNGAGKTTLLRVLLREEPFDQGVVLVNGVDISTIRGASLTKFRRKIGMVFQDTRLLPNATVSENVGLPLKVRGRSNRDVSMAVNEVLKRVALLEKASRFPKQLSGGEQRKVALARAIISRPEILLCDEPTDSINPLHAREIIELLLDINADGVTTLVATHDSDIVNDLRRRVIRMDAGGVLEDMAVGVFNTS